MNNLSSSEKSIISFIREAKPYERIEIIKDQNGRIDHYIIHRSQKIVLQPNVVIK